MFTIAMPQSTVQVEDTTRELEASTNTWSHHKPTTNFQSTQINRQTIRQTIRLTTKQTIETDGQTGRKTTKGTLQHPNLEADNEEERKNKFCVFSLTGQPYQQ